MYLASRSTVVLGAALLALGGFNAAAAADAASTAPAASAAAPNYDAPTEVELSFKLHIEDDLPEQDVFVERPKGSGKLFRPTKGERDLSQPVYAAAEYVPHDPFGADAIGPWPMGRPLGMNLGRWYEAEGTGRYRCANGEGSIDMSFSGLVPNGVYTVWHFFMALPPTEPFIGTYDLPMGSRDGAQSVFNADARGVAKVSRSFKPCLQLTGEHLTSGLAIAWHSDSKTYGPEPGKFGLNSHVQLYLMLPKRAGF